MEKKIFFNAFEKAIGFVSQLTTLQLDLLGYPIFETHSDYVDIRFCVRNTIRDFDVIKLSCDEFRMFADGDTLILVYTFFSGNEL